MNDINNNRACEECENCYSCNFCFGCDYSTECSFSKGLIFCHGIRFGAMLVFNKEIDPSEYVQIFHKVKGKKLTKKDLDWVSKIPGFDIEIVHRTTGIYL